MAPSPLIPRQNYKKVAQSESIPIKRKRRRRRFHDYITIRILTQQ